MNKKMQYAVFTLIILLIAVGTLLWYYRQTEAKNGGRLYASGTIETTEVSVGSRLGGRIRKVLFKEGDFVRPGDTLVQLDPYQLPEQRQELESQLLRARAVLAEMEQGARPEEIAAAAAQYRQAQAQADMIAEGARQEEIERAKANRRQTEQELENARLKFERFQSLYERQVISSQEFDEVRTRHEVSQERFRAAQQQEQELLSGRRPQEIIAAREQARAQREHLRLLQSGTRSEQIAAQRAVVKSIEAQIKQLDITGEELAVRSPCSCQISSMNIKPGQLIMPSQTMATLTDLDDLWVRVYIPEERFGLVRPGDTASVKVDPYPKRKFQGTVIQLASRAEFTPRNVQTEQTRRMQVFGVKVAINNTEGLLRPGMPADVTFSINPQDRRLTQR
jgi:HlyD family secretion protein